MTLRLTAAVLLTVLPLLAQDDDKPLTIGDFENTGSISTGYRAVGVSGYRPSYQNLFGLDSGFRLLDFDVFGRAKPGTNAFADSYSIVTSGLGGEPWSTTQIAVDKKDVYDLRASFRQSYYYVDPNAGAPTPNGLHGLLPNHDWATVRRMGSLNLLVHATNNLRFRLEYSRNTRDGAEDTTRVMDFFGSPSSFGSFERANPYYLVGDIAENTNRITAGMDYTLRSWTFHYTAGVQRFDDSFTGANPFGNERSIDVDDPTTAKELLSVAQWSDSRRLSTPVSELSWNGKLAPKLRTSGSYIFQDYAGPAALDMSASGLARGSTTSIIQPYSFSDTSTARLKEPNQLAEENFSWDASSWLSMEANYRYTRLHVTSDALFSSISDCCGTATAANGTVQAGAQLNEWLIGMSTVSYDLVLTPVSRLMIRLGTQYMKRDIIYRTDGTPDPEATMRVKSVLPVLSVSYDPNRIISIRANFDELNNGTSYTRDTPHTDIGSRIVTRIHPADKLHIDNTTLVRSRKLLTVGYDSHVKNNSTTVTYDLAEHFSGFAGFSYNSFYSISYADFLRGTAPITNVSMTDQEVERLWQAGFDVKALKRLSLRFAGNYIRVNGQGVMMGEQPLYGPVTFPTASGALSYEFLRAGKLTVQLQRAYYLEQILAANSFSAGVLLVEWTRSF
ncbi:MAG TPA: hypothetical protein VHC90_17695 [Bryobacteraceae bacterium]|nr:hypothetical protein [Bryobacteraceae bacterium]